MQPTPLPVVRPSMLRRSTVFTLLVVLVSALAVTSAASAAEGDAAFGDITRAGCDVTIPVTTYVAGTYTLTVYDDGQVVEETTWEANAGDIFEVHWTIAEAAKEAVPGVGFYVTDAEGEDVVGIDPWEYPAAAADACAEAGSMTVTLVGATTVRPGDPIVFEAGGFWPEEAVAVEVRSTPILIATLTSDVDGKVSGAATLPTDIAPGEHSLVLTGELSGLTVSTSFTVADVEPAPPAAPVPTDQVRFTG